MDNVQLLALTIAGVVLPFLHERFLAAHLEGAYAAWFNFAACMVIASVATIAFGGFGSASFADPVAFTAFLLGKAAGVFALAQLVFHTASKQVAKVAPPQP
jgi:hypothetical protein